MLSSRGSVGGASAYVDAHGLCIDSVHPAVDITRTTHWPADRNDKRAPAVVDTAETG